ncbi:MAG: hypothetical protein ACE5OZ_02340 [Candidatus Heimdallarchaeota archaeon]
MSANYIKCFRNYISKRTGDTELGRRGSTYRARIDVLIRTCLELAREDGTIRTAKLANRLRLSDRMIRDYMTDLQILRILKYVGPGTYQPNQEITLITDTDPFDFPETSVSLERLLTSPRYIHALKEIDSIQEKVNHVFKKMEYTYTLPDEIRTALRKSTLEQTGIALADFEKAKFLGDFLIQPERATSAYLDNIVIPGSASTKSLSHIRLLDFSLLTVALMTASSYATLFKRNSLSENHNRFVDIPQLQRFEGTAPFRKPDTFYEMVTDFPELLMTGRSIAARFLTEITQLQADLEMLKRLDEQPLGEYLPVYLRKGSMTPHGFLVIAPSLRRLQRECRRLLKDLLEFAYSRGIILAAVSSQPRDDFFFRVACETLGKNLGQMNDLLFFNQILIDGDITCLVENHSKKGKPPIPNTFDFYMKRGDIVVKTEFQAINEPLLDQKTLTELLMSLISPRPNERFSPGPSIVLQAEMRATNHRQMLENRVHSALHFGFQQLLDVSQQNYDNYLWRT